MKLNKGVKKMRVKYRVVFNKNNYEEFNTVEEAKRFAKRYMGVKIVEVKGGKRR